MLELRPNASANGVRLGAYAERRERPLGSLDQVLVGGFEAIRSKIMCASGRHTVMVSKMERLAPRMQTMTDRELRLYADALRPRLLRKDKRQEAICESFALIREGAQRKLSLTHYPVQLLGGLCLLEGTLAEMRTGEGKTIVALLPAITVALTGTPVHVITVNDYLAKRDAEQLAPVYALFGLDVGLIQAGQPFAERKHAYNQDVTYCSNKELVFDYLRDRIAQQRNSARPRPERSALLLRGLHFAIVDEADSVLVDEARTPLIISSERDTSADRPRYVTALQMAQELVKGHHYRIATDASAVLLTPKGCAALAEQSERLEGVWRSKRAREELLQQALTALMLFERDKQYLVVDNKVRIVDEYTGRVMADRSWVRGLHQLIEIKEGCALSNQRESLAQITYQRFFRRYLRLAGMTGTALEVAAELRAVYGLRTHRIPTNRPDVRIDLGCRIWASAEEKWQAVAQSAAEHSRRGRPVLIGTRSVAASETISAVLKRRQIAHVVLNARQDQAEAEAVAAAGCRSQITVATNMAGRGTDIQLGAGVAKLGGLHVILTEYHESARIDRQLIGRCGRQGDPGSYEAITCLEDELYSRYAPGLNRLFKGRPQAASSRHLGRLLRKVAQGAADRQHARTRRQIVRRDQDLDRAFAFAGQPD